MGTIIANGFPWKVSTTLQPERIRRTTRTSRRSRVAVVTSTAHGIFHPATGSPARADRSSIQAMNVTGGMPSDCAAERTRRDCAIRLLLTPASETVSAVLSVRVTTRLTLVQTPTPVRDMHEDCTSGPQSARAVAGAQDFLQYPS